ncbi:hypothetical protein V9T40_011128 [Parthenolecanium corni]|uniref:Uncharacterized protein n=1 Tax=Parthenolecanium corni TaxID=536013 RepID=A0AAN9TI26_9HEMI
MIEAIIFFNFQSLDHCRKELLNDSVESNHEDKQQNSSSNGNGGGGSNTICSASSSISSSSSSSSMSVSPNCSQHLLEEALKRGPPYPTVVLPLQGGYWSDGSDHYDTGPNSSVCTSLPPCNFKFETDDTAKCYRRFFMGRVLCLDGLMFNATSRDCWSETSFHCRSENYVVEFNGCRYLWVEAHNQCMIDI